MSFHDKSYQYDDVGRLQTALSGVEANDFLNNTNSDPLHGPAPYLQSYTHDAWSNMVERTGLYWSENDEIGPQGYDAHNRNAAWSYDADGRLMSMNEPPFNEHPYVPAMHTYDAAGRHVKNTQTTSRVTAFPGNPVHTTITTIDSGYDGDGQQVKRVETTQLNSQPPAGGPGYYLRSSVLGQVISEYDTQGAKQKSHVYGGGALIASTSSGGLVWRYNNPVTGDGRETDVQGELVAAAYVDPQGVDVGASDPADNHGEPPPPEPLPNAGAYAAYLPRNLGGSGRCSVNGAQTGCAFVAGLLAAGAADQCLNNDCGTHQVTVIGRNRSGDVISRDSIDVRDGDPRWNGALDGSYGVYDRNGWGRNDGQDFLAELAKYGTRPNEFYRLVSAALPQKTAGQRCDDRLAGMFGGDGSVFATDRDPSTLANPGARNRNRLLSPSESPVNGHAHIYASPTGAGVAGGNLFTPTGYKTEERAPYTAHQDTIPELQNYHRFTYLPGSLQRFGYSGGVVISFIHSGPTNSSGRPFPASATDKPGSVLVGTIGNFGGLDVGGSDPGYVHTHIRFYSADRRGRRGATLDPRRVFCHDLGF